MRTHPKPATAGWFTAVALVLTACNSRETQALLQPPQALGVVLAEEAARAAGANKRVALIAPDAHWGPASTVEETFRNAMQKRGISVVIVKSADLGDPMRSRPRLKSVDFLEALGKATNAGAVVSIVGAPELAPQDVARLGSGHPPALVVATMTLGAVPGVAGDRIQLANLLEAGVIQLAIVDGAEPAPPIAGKLDATHGVFAQHYRMLRSQDAKLQGPVSLLPTGCTG
ncbi:MAG TPA: hypothetical protein VMU04_11570 [Candidatus Acidoferrum sp.]|nr:hypothetical protein [Candidatus Acidoferrum sp.]